MRLDIPEKIFAVITIGSMCVLFFLLGFWFYNTASRTPDQPAQVAETHTETLADGHSVTVEGPVQVEAEPEPDPPPPLFDGACYTSGGTIVWRGTVRGEITFGNERVQFNSASGKQITIDGPSVCIWEE